MGYIARTSVNYAYRVTASDNLIIPMITSTYSSNVLAGENKLAVHLKNYFGTIRVKVKIQLVQAVDTGTVSFRDEYETSLGSVSHTGDVNWTDKTIDLDLKDINTLVMRVFNDNGRDTHVKDIQICGDPVAVTDANYYTDNTIDL